MVERNLPSYQSISQDGDADEIRTIEFASLNDSSLKKICSRSTAVIFFTAVGIILIIFSIYSLPQKQISTQLETTSSKLLICQYGGYCRKNSDCVPGNKCNIQSQYYSQCVPDPTQYSTNPSCVQEWGQCSSNSICCDPGAVCNSNHQCTQSPICVNPNSYGSYSAEDDHSSSSPSLSPSFIPSNHPTSKLLICQYGGYCRKDSDCFPGNKCSIKSQYYSQCVPDPTKYSTYSNCIGDNGIECSDSSICCDPGAVCNTNNFRQCSQISSFNCVNPNSYSSFTEDDRYDSNTPSPSQSPSQSPLQSPSQMPSQTPSQSSSQTITHPRINWNVSSSSFPSLAPVHASLSSAPRTPVSSPTGGAVIASSPSPSNPNLICQYGGYCYRDSDCVAGNRCNILSAYYSQCVADPSQYRSDEGCLLNGGSPCNSTTICCDPGAFCNYNMSIPQCTPIDSPLCRFPNIFANATSQPIFSPTESPSLLPFHFISNLNSSTGGLSAPPTLQPTAESPSIPSGSFSDGKGPVPSQRPAPPTISAMPTLTKADITFHRSPGGGHVQTGPITIYHIYYGDISSNTQYLMNYFAANLGGSSIYSVLSAYYGLGNTYVSTQVTFGNNPVTLLPTARGGSLTDAIVQSTIQDQITKSKLPAVNSAFYAFMFRGDFAFPGWPDQWCAFHNVFTANAPNGQKVKIKYGVIGDPSSPYANSIAQKCITYDQPSLTANKDISADSMASVYMHELAESITNFDQDAWYFDGGCPWANGGSNSGNEIGDACNFDFGVDTSKVNWNTKIGSKNFLIQRLWQWGGYQCVLYRH